MSMKLPIFLLPFFFLFSGCSAPGSEKAECWQVNEITPGLEGVETGMRLTYHEDSLVFINGTDSVSFGFLESGDRIILQNGEGKRLFSQIKSQDSLVIWRELYTDHPLVIRLTRK